MLRGISQALRGTTGEYEISRLIGAFGSVVYIVAAPTFMAWEMIEGRPFDLTEFCLAYPGGLAAVVTATAGAVAIKDRNVATAKVTERSNAKTQVAPPSGKLAET